MERSSVLIADSHPDIRRLIVVSIASPGYELVEASGGHEAWELARLLRPRVAILDQHLPYLDGFELTRRIREHPDLHGMAIVLMTTDPSLQIRLRARQEGATVCLSKPFSPMRLATQVDLAFQLAPA